MLKINRKLFGREKDEISPAASSSAPANAYDTVFAEAFKAALITHLERRHVDGVPDGENAPWDMVAEAIKCNDTGKLSRIFDQLKLLCMDQEAFFANIDNSGGMTNFIRPLVEELSRTLFNEDRTEVRQEVIDAIGEDNYRAITHPDGDATPPAVVTQKKIEIVNTVASSVIVCYSQNIESYQVTPEQAALQNKAVELYAAMENLKSAIRQRNDGKDVELLGRDIASVLVSHETAENTFNEIDKAIAACSNVAALENSTLEHLVSEHRRIEALRDGAEAYVNKSIVNFTSQCMSPLQTLAYNFSFERFQNAASLPQFALPDDDENLVGNSGINREIEHLIIRIDTIQRGLVKLETSTANNEQVSTVYNTLQARKASLQENPLTSTSTPEEIAQKIVAYNQAKNAMNDQFVSIEPILGAWASALRTETSTIVSNELSKIQGLPGGSDTAAAVATLNTEVTRAIPNEQPLALFERLNTATNNFSSAVNQLQVEPPAPVKSIIFRVFRAIGLGLTTGKFSLTTAAEREERARFSEQSKLKEDLHKLKESSASTHLAEVQVEAEKPAPKI